MIDKQTAITVAKKHYNDVYAYCLSYAHCSESEAQDITQEVFLTFQEKLDSLENQNIRRWLLITAKNKVREFYRENKKDAMLVPLEPDTIPTADMYIYIDKYLTECEELSEEYIEKCKQLILKSLSKSELEIYTKIFIEKKTHQQIADELNSSKNAVSLRASKLQRKIKALVKLSLSVIGSIIIKTIF